MTDLTCAPRVAGPPPADCTVAIIWDDQDEPCACEVENDRGGRRWAIPGCDHWSIPDDRVLWHVALATGQPRRAGR